MTGPGAKATFAVSWAQTTINGVAGGPVQALVPGATWRWSGPIARLNGPEGPLMLGADGLEALRRKAAASVSRMLRQAPSRQEVREDADDLPDDLPEDLPDDLPDEGFIVTDGIRRHAVCLVHSRETGARMAIFQGIPPPRATCLRVLRVQVDPCAGLEPAGGMICFTPGTVLATGTGPRRIEELRPGDLVETCDDGLLPVIWRGARRVSGARLFATPALRPVRIRGGAFGIGRPDGDLVVSPQHRMLVRGAAVQDVFNAPEALVAAEALVNGGSVSVDLTPGDVTYVHILLERHAILFANGLKTESFHPAGAALDELTVADRASLSFAVPGVMADPESYGPYARRSLTGAEAAILRHRLAA